MDCKRLKATCLAGGFAFATSLGGAFPAHATGMTITTSFAGGGNWALTTALSSGDLARGV
jgi:hypothetical protein